MSGDGTSIGKRLHVINFTFTLLDEGDKAYSYEGNHSLAIFKEQESYEGLGNALEDIIKEVKSLDEITVADNVFSIEYFLVTSFKILSELVSEQPSRHSKIIIHNNTERYFTHNFFKFL